MRSTEREQRRPGNEATSGPNLASRNQVECIKASDLRNCTTAFASYMREKVCEAILRLNKDHEVAYGYCTAAVAYGYCTAAVLHMQR